MAKHSETEITHSVDDLATTSLSVTRRAAFGLLGGGSALALSGVRPAAAEVRIDITRGNVEPLPIAITEFFGVSAQEDQIGRDIASVVTADLERSGLFSAIDPRAFIQTAASMKVRPRFSDWRVVNAQALVNGTVELREDGRVRVEFRLWDVFAEAQMLGRAYQTEQPHWRRVAHIISDAIYQRITGEQGYFDTRIVYVAESGPKIDRTRRLAIMDQDGANHRFLTDGRAMALTPRFSPARQEITYLSYFNNTPRVYLFNIRTGRQEVLGAFDGMTFAPRFSPDGNSVIMSHAQNGNSDIYIMDLRTRTPRRLTSNPAIDTAPSFAPDGAQITFESDRGGSQQIYVMDADGGSARRISFGDGSYGTPVWSPRGDLIAFTKQNAGRFHIGVMRTDGSEERLLTASPLDEGPTWSPNGRVLMFTRESLGASGTSSLYTTDVGGLNLRAVPVEGGASDAGWGPLQP